MVDRHRPCPDRDHEVDLAIDWGDIAKHRDGRGQIPSVDPVQCRPLVGRDVVGLVALDLVMRLVLARPATMPLVVEVLRVDLGDRARHLSRLGVPADVVADIEVRTHCSSSPRVLMPMAPA